MTTQWSPIENGLKSWLCSMTALCEALGQKPRAGKPRAIRPFPAWSRVRHGHDTPSHAFSLLRISLSCCSTCLKKVPTLRHPRHVVVKTFLGNVLGKLFIATFIHLVQMETPRDAKVL